MSECKINTREEFFEATKSVHESSRQRLKALYSSKDEPELHEFGVVAMAVHHALSVRNYDAIKFLSEGEINGSSTVFCHSTCMILKDMILREAHDLGKHPHSAQLDMLSIVKHAPFKPFALG